MRIKIYLNTKRDLELIALRFNPALDFGGIAREILRSHVRSEKYVIPQSNMGKYMKRSLTCYITLDDAEDADEIEKAQGNMPQVGIGIVLILAFIGIMNYMNTFVVNVQSRMTELSVMESIGMTPKQLLGMLVREGVLYAGSAWLVTLTAGMGVTYLIYESMNYRGIAFSVPLLPLLFAVGISFLVCTMVPVLTWIILEKNGTVVERIKGVE